MGERIVKNAKEIQLSTTNGMKMQVLTKIQHHLKSNIFRMPLCLENTNRNEKLAKSCHSRGTQKRGTQQWQRRNYAKYRHSRALSETITHCARTQQ